MSNKKSNGGGMSVFGALGVAFIVLKLTDSIEWSWWWVTAPFWGGAVLFIVASIFMAATTPKKRR